MLKTGYQIFVHGLEELEEGKEVEIQIMDVQTYGTKNVKALLSSSAKKLPDGENLWVRSMLGVLIDENPWRIKIISEI